MTLVPLGLFTAIVFAVTYFYTTGPRDPLPLPEKDPTTEAPLKFFTAARMWDPTSDNLSDRIFPGYFEPSEDHHSTAFWFENRNSEPVDLRLQRVSCTACSGGAVAAIPPDALRQLLQVDAVSMLPLGPLAGCPIGVGEAAANLYSNLKWEEHKFAKPELAVYSIPGAANTDGWSPQWGILSLQFKVNDGAKPPLTAFFLSRVRDTNQVGSDRFDIRFIPAPPFVVDRAGIDAGELTDTSPAQVHDLLIYSNTRTHEELKGLIVRVQLPVGESGEPGPFVATGPLIPVPQQELDEIAKRLATKEAPYVRVKSAYRLQVTVQTKVDGKQADIGRLDRLIGITDGIKALSVFVKANVNGPVALVNGTQMQLGSFPSPRGTTEIFTIETEQSGVELSLVRELTQPEYMQVVLEKQPDVSGRGSYKVKVTIPANKQAGDISHGVVVLDVKGPTPRRVRIPVKGYGTLN
jgi:hypothetical protein